MFTYFIKKQDERKLPIDFLIFFLPSISSFFFVMHFILFFSFVYLFLFISQLQLQIALDRIAWYRANNNSQVTTFVLNSFTPAVIHFYNCMTH